MAFIKNLDEWRLMALVVLCLLLVLGVLAGVLCINLINRHKKAEASTTVQRPSWCVLKPGTSLKGAIQNINFVCDYMNCDIIREGEACFLPEDMYSHASVLMNLYYQNKGGNTWDCNFSGAGLITISDPSHGSCVYATSEN